MLQYNNGPFCTVLPFCKKEPTEKKVEPKWLHPGAVLKNGATLEGGAVFSLIGSGAIINLFLVENGTTLQSSTKTVPK